MSVDLNINGPVAKITINRPDVLNALNKTVLGEIYEHTQKISHDASIRIVLLEGAGGKAFVAGADISQMKNYDAKAAENFSRKGHEVMTSFEKLPQITIACVNGFALGGGCELAMACDLILATKNSKFGQPEVHLGLVPGFGGTQRLIRRVGYSIASEMLLTGRPLSGEEAYQFGLVSRVVDQESFSSLISETVNFLLKGGPVALSQTKKLLQFACDHSLSKGNMKESQVFGSLFSQAEAKEGLSAFSEKRKANFFLKV